LCNDKNSQKFRKRDRRFRFEKLYLWPRGSHACTHTPHTHTRLRTHTHTHTRTHTCTHTHTPHNAQHTHTPHNAQHTHTHHYHPLQMKTRGYQACVKEYLELIGETINEQWWNMLHHTLTTESPVVTICTTSLSFSNSTFCPHSCIYVFCVDLNTNSDYFPIQQLPHGFYNRDGVCLLHGTNWVFIYNSTFCPYGVFMGFVQIWAQTATISLYSINLLVFITEMKCVYWVVQTGYLYIILHSAHTVYLCGLCGSEHKQWLFPYTALTDQFL